jgi:CheY-like chemotaxis protein
MATVLVVDDTKVIRDTVGKLLRTEGFDTLCCANGKEALEALHTSHPDVLLLDIMMPEMDGLTLLQMVRSLPEGKKLPVIMMTALSDDESHRRAAALGANEYLVKATFTVRDIINNIRRLLPS